MSNHRTSIVLHTNKKITPDVSDGLNELKNKSSSEDQIPELDVAYIILSLYLLTLTDRIH